VVMLTKNNIVESPGIGGHAVDKARFVTFSSLDGTSPSGDETGMSRPRGI